MGCHGAGDRRARSVGVASALVRRQKRTAMSSVTATFTRWLDKRGVLCRDRTRVCGIPIAGEAQTSNLQACGGCDMRLAQRIGAELATTKVVPYASMAWHIR